MNMAFGPEDWTRVHDAYESWWQGTLDRPILHLYGGGRDPGRPQPALQLKGTTAAYGPEVTPEQIVDGWDWGLSRVHYLGDAFPQIRPNFGAGCNAAFLGAPADVTDTTVWFHAPADIELPDLNLRYDPDNPWLNRVKAICRTAAERWRGTVCVGMCDLTPNLDTLSVFRPSEKLIYDLYDHPDQIRRLLPQLADTFWRFFEEIHGVMRPYNPGYTCWIPLLSRVPYYAVQCDFCYMISPAMFNEFVRPDLVDATRRIPRTIYHLDGPGQLAHLDDLLSIEKLDGIQWVPGAGQKPEREWLEVYKRIHAAGKRIVIHQGFESLDAIAQALGTAKGIALIHSFKADQRGDIERRLEQWGAS